MLGLLVLSQLSGDQMAQRHASQILSCSVIQGDSLATKEVAPSMQHVGYACHLRGTCLQHFTPLLLSGETHESQTSNIMLASVIFCLLFLSAGLPDYGQRKYRTPKRILECSSLLMNWIKPIKGMPS